MAGYWPADQGGCIASHIPKLSAFADMPGQSSSQQTALSLGLAPQASTSRFRNIAPRPAGTQDSSLESQSPSSSTDNSADDSLSGKGMVAKRIANSKTPFLSQTRKRTTVPLGIHRASPRQKKLQRVAPFECQIRPAPRSPAEVLKEFQALDATPLGKLLRATPDVKVGGATITWGSAGPGIVTSEFGRVVGSPYSSQCPSSPSSPLPPILPHGSSPSSLPSTPFYTMILPPTLPSSNMAPCSQHYFRAASSASKKAVEKGPTRALFPLSSSARRSVSHSPLSSGGPTPACSGNTSAITETPPHVISTDGNCAVSGESQSFVSTGLNLGRNVAGGLGRSRVVLNEADMEHTYGTPTEPAALTNEDHQLLWANTAFKKVSSEAAPEEGRNQGSAADILAFPVPVSSLLFQPTDGTPPCKAVLWAFLKKIDSACSQTNVSGPEISNVQGQPTGESSHALTQDLQAGNVFMPLPAPSCSPTRKEASAEDSRHKVIHPRVIRSIGSTIQIDNVAPIDTSAVSTKGTFDSVRVLFDPVDRCRSPVILTDMKGQVRWVNMAYKLLTGQPKCSWLGVATGGNSLSSSARLTGEVTLAPSDSLSELQGRGVVGVTCVAEVRWGRGVGGETNRSSLRLPAMATRLDSLDQVPRPLGYIWHFDTAAAGVRLEEGQ